jgi:ribosomal protein L4
MGRRSARSDRAQHHATTVAHGVVRPTGSWQLRKTLWGNGAQRGVLWAIAVATVSSLLPQARQRRAALEVDTERWPWHRKGTRTLTGHSLGSVSPWVELQIAGSRRPIVVG